MKRPAPLRPALTAWLAWVAIDSAITGWAFGARPDLVSSSAYSWATGIISAREWGVVFALCSLGALISLHAHSATMARVVLVGHAITHIVFGASIFYLTLEGTTSAITGALKWWAVAYGNLIMLRLPSLRVAPGEEEAKT